MFFETKKKSLVLAILCLVLLNQLRVAVIFYVVSVGRKKQEWLSSKF